MIEAAMLRKVLKTTVHSLLYELQGLLGNEPLAHRGIYILMYHRISWERDEAGIAISPDFFEQQIGFLKERFAIIDLDRALGLLDREIDRPYFVITFDDGYRDNFTDAYPILRRYEAPATIFIACDHIETGATAWHQMDTAIRRTALQRLDLTAEGLGSFPLATLAERRQCIRTLHRLLKKLDNGSRLAIMAEIGARCGFGGDDRIMLQWDEVKAMADEGLVTIGSHTLSHPILTRIPAEQVRREIEISKGIIEEKIGRNVEHFAYPNGRPEDFDESTVELIRRSGYRSACTTIAGCNQTGGDLFRLRRIDVTYGLCEDFGGRFSRRMFGYGLGAAANRGGPESDRAAVWEAGGGSRGISAG